MQHQNLFVFDIETIPDTDAVPNLTGFDDPDVETRRAELERYHPIAGLYLHWLIERPGTLTT